MKTFLLSAFLLLNLHQAFSQTQDSLAENKQLNYFSFRYDNDFFSATDRYYTQGIELSFFHQLAKQPAILTFSGDQAGKYFAGVRVEQDVFTPRSIRYKSGAVYEGERPFSAIFYVAPQLVSLSEKNKSRLSAELLLGFIGPAALGEEEQKGIHKALNNIEPEGWDNQISQDVLLNLNIGFEKGVINTKHYLLTLQSDARAGTLWTDARVGLNSQFGVFSSYFSTLGRTNNKTKNKTFLCYGFIRGGVRAVAYNATLQGGVFNKDNIYILPAGSISRIVGDAGAGIVIAYSRFSLEYSRYYVTGEFSDGVDHGWGRCVLSLCF